MRHWVRERRLHACRDELAAPGVTGATVASVGRRWGFSDPTNFGRVFKAAYGSTPLEWRLLHQEDSGHGHDKDTQRVVAAPRAACSDGP